MKAKVILLIFVMSFIFIGNVSAATVEENINTLKNSIQQLETKVTNLENNRLNKMYPVGSIYITTTYTTAAQVNNALGGTWEVYGSGRTLVGVNANDGNFNTVNKTGGSSTNTLSTGNLPSHTHSIPALSGTAASAGAHTHSIPALSGSTNSAGAHRHGIGQASNSGNLYGWMNSSGTIQRNIGYNTASYMCDAAGAHTHTVTTKTSTTGSDGAHTHNVTTKAGTSGGSGSGTAFTNLQPYITVYMYKRKA